MNWILIICCSVNVLVYSWSFDSRSSNGREEEAGPKEGKEEVSMVSHSICLLNNHCKVMVLFCRVKR